MHQLIKDNDIIIDNNSIFSYDEHINLSKKIIKFNDPNTKTIIAKKIKTKNIKFPFLDFIFLSEEEKEKYFSSGGVGCCAHTHTHSNNQNIIWLMNQN